MDSSLFLAEWLTLNMMPIYTQLTMVEVPPLLMSGKGCPVTGTKPTATAMLNMACVANSNANPMMSKAGKVLAQRLAIEAVRKSRTIYRKQTKAAPQMPISSMMMA